ncbi:MAG: ATPase, T2SS/T4P/T4SS family [Candidatus Caldarchaeum sp.]
MTENVLICPSCGAENPEGAGFCMLCGRKLIISVEKETKKTKKTEPVREKPVSKKHVKTPTTVEKAEDILKALQQFLLTNLPTPKPLSEPDELTEAETLARYQVGLSTVRIARLDTTGLYLVTEPPISSEGKLVYALTLDTLFRESTLPPVELVRQPMRIGRESGREEAIALDNMITAVIIKQLNRLGIQPTNERILEVKYYVNRNVFGYGPVDVPVNDPAVEDISCVGPRIPVMIAHRDFGHLHYLTSNIVFSSDDEINDFMNRHAHRSNTVMTLHKPYADFPLTDGSRFAGILGRELSAFGPTFTIRKWPTDPWSLPRIIRMKMLTPLMAAYIWFALENKALIGIAGPTASGKTSLFTALLACLNPNSKIITIEDTYEINIPLRHWLPLTGRRSAMIAAGQLEISESELIDIAMRMRPDFLVIGEVRKDESVYHLLKSAFTGHGGGFTFHAGSPSEFYSRLSLMLRKTGMSEAMLAFLWGCVITSFQDTPNGRARRVTSIAEIFPAPEKPEGMEVQDIFRYRASDDSFHPDSIDEVISRSRKLRWYLQSMGYDEEYLEKQLRNRVEAIKYGVERNMSSTVFHQYVAEVRRRWT